MKDDRYQLPPRQTLRFILLPMVATFFGLRLYLHNVRVQHVYPGGYLVHHLFTGALIVILAAFVLAFGTRRRQTAIATHAALGIGSAMVLDEVVYLIATQASDADYVSHLSLYGGGVFMTFGVILLFALYHHRQR